MFTCLFLDTEDRRHFPPEARHAIHEVSAAVAVELRRLLPDLPEELELAMQTGSKVIAETGELGSAYTSRRISWTVDARRQGGVEATARTQLRHTLFHECHHLVRGWVMTGQEHRGRFIEGVICEGLASAFERDASGRDAPWARYPAEAEQWVQELLALPRGSNYRHWMFHHPDGRRWVGYRAGTFLADRAIAASGRSAAELVRVPADEILHLAGMVRYAGSA